MNLYGVFYKASTLKPMETSHGIVETTDRWGMTTSKRNALLHAKRMGGIVTMLKGPKANWKGAWDAPTLRAVSDIIADFTEDNHAV